MPESKVRKEAKKKKHLQRKADAEQRRAAKDLTGKTRPWVPYVFIPVGLLGVLWMVTYNLAGGSIEFMRSLGDWNVAIGMGLIIASFGLMTLWK
ncbi:MAG: cell division protein CrgA [Arachnia sp.]